MRPKKSYFTRVQRLTCALALLMLMMITNAMWFEDPSTSTINGQTSNNSAADTNEDDTTENKVSFWCSVDLFFKVLTCNFNTFCKSSSGIRIFILFSSTSRGSVSTGTLVPVLATLNMVKLK